MKFFHKVQGFCTSLDILSPEIKLYNEDKKHHRPLNFFGGILSIFVVSLSIAASIYFLLDLFIRTNPKAYTLNKFEDIVPKIEISPSELMFALRLKTFDFELNSSYVSYFADFIGGTNTNSIQLLAKYEMRKCDFDRDFGQNKKAFIDYKEDLNSFYYCLGDMYLEGSGPPITQDDPRYFYPYMKDGLQSLKGKPTSLLAGVRRCVNSTSNNNSCVSNDLIDEVLSKGASFSCLLKNKIFDPTNYATPIQDYAALTQHTSGPSTSRTTFLNYKNVEFKTHDGFVFDDTKILNSYEFDTKVETMMDNRAGGSLNPSISSVYFALQNTPVVHERYYVTLQEILAKIGGVVKVLVLMAQIINSFFYNYNEKKKFLNNILKSFVVFNKNLKLLRRRTDDEEEVLSSRKKQELELSTLPDDKGGDPNNGPEQANQKDPNEKEKQMQKSVHEIANLKILNYYTMKTKKILKKKTKNKTISFLHDIENVEKEIFNRKTFFKLYFDMEKLKSILLTENEKIAFNTIKLDWNSIEEIICHDNKKKINLQDVYYNLTKSTRKKSKILGKLMKEIIEI